MGRLQGKVAFLTGAAQALRGPPDGGDHSCGWRIVGVLGRDA